MQFLNVKIGKPEAANFIVGQRHFIKTGNNRGHVFRRLVLLGGMRCVFVLASRSILS